MYALLTTTALYNWIPGLAVGSSSNPSPYDGFPTPEREMSDVCYPGLGKEDDDLVQRVHGLPGKARDEQNPLGVPGLTVDLRGRACPCDTSATIPASELPSLPAPPQLLA